MPRIALHGSPSLPARQRRADHDPGEKCGLEHGPFRLQRGRMRGSRCHPGRSEAEIRGPGSPSLCRVAAALYQRPQPGTHRETASSYRRPREGGGPSPDLSACLGGTNGVLPRARPPRNGRLCAPPGSGMGPRLRGGDEQGRRRYRFRSMTAGITGPRRPTGPAWRPVSSAPGGRRRLRSGRRLRARRRCRPPGRSRRRCP